MIFFAIRISPGAGFFSIKIIISFQLSDDNPFHIIIVQESIRLFFIFYSTSDKTPIVLCLIAHNSDIIKV